MSSGLLISQEIKVFLFWQCYEEALQIMKEDMFLKEAQATVQARNPPKKENLLAQSQTFHGTSMNPLQVHGRSFIAPESIPGVQSFKCCFMPGNSLSLPNKDQMEVPPGWQRWELLGKIPFSYWLGKAHAHGDVLPLLTESLLPPRESRKERWSHFSWGMKQAQTRMIFIRCSHYCYSWHNTLNFKGNYEKILGTDAFLFECELLFSVQRLNERFPSERKNNVKVRYLSAFCPFNVQRLKPKLSKNSLILSF